MTWNGPWLTLLCCHSKGASPQDSYIDLLHRSVTSISYIDLFVGVMHRLLNLDYHSRLLLTSVEKPSLLVIMEPKYSQVLTFSVWSYWKIKRQIYRRSAQQAVPIVITYGAKVFTISDIFNLIILKNKKTNLQKEWPTGSPHCYCLWNQGIVI